MGLPASGTLWELFQSHLVQQLPAFQPHQLVAFLRCNNFLSMSGQLHIKSQSGVASSSDGTVVEVTLALLSCLVSCNSVKGSTDCLATNRCVDNH